MKDFSLIKDGEYRKYPYYCRLKAIWINSRYYTTNFWFEIIGEPIIINDLSWTPILAHDLNAPRFIETDCVEILNEQKYYEILSEKVYGKKKISGLDSPLGP